MQNEITDYITELNRQYETCFATEHTYRSALQQLLATRVPHLIVSNEPARQACGAPDLILHRKEDNIPVAYVETKDVGDTDLTGRNKHKEQFDRYKRSLDNIIFTDYLDFLIYQNGEFVESIRIAELKGEQIQPLHENFARFESMIKRFGNAAPQKITTSTQLAEVMAGKARLMAQVIDNVLARGNGSKLAGQLEAFQDVLIHDIAPKAFADVYAQTIAYGMFAARLHGTTDHFSREEASKLIPKNNPFLRELFQNIAGYDLDENIRWVVDDLAEFFRVADMRAVMLDFGTRTRQTDPMIHFYENFLSAYDPSLRKSRGVWYTPQAVVSFIVRAADEIVQTEFGLPLGLADTSTAKITVPVKQSRLTSEKRKQAGVKEIEVHKVQILDPAVGTGTFLAETVSLIHERFQDQHGLWQGYVEKHLIPRLNGFELLMASYTMAHINLAWLFRQTGHETVGDQRFRIYLTNSLEEHHPETGTFFHQFLAREANEANSIKRDVPVMVVMGNPPYSGESQNKGKWMTGLMEDYKKEPDTNSPLQERNPKWINDDYCKFIRLGQYFVEKNTEGVLAYINNHSFIDNPTFRGMRWNLMRSFDKIYIIDLHGNSKKKETAPDGGKDENVFDIQQGVSINIFVKKGRKAKGELAEVYHYDLYGKRQRKFNYLLQHKLSTVPFKKLKPSTPQFFFVPRKTKGKRLYDKGFSVREMFPVNSIGIVTARDSLTIHYTKEELIETIRGFIRLDTEAARKRLELGNDTRDWSIAGAKNDLTTFPDDKKIVEINYRPFDKRYTYYTGVTKGFHCMPRETVMRHFLKGENVGLVIPRINKEDGCVFVTRHIMGHKLCSAYDSNSIFPLYLYPNGIPLPKAVLRTPNLNPEIVGKIAESLNMKFEDEKSCSPRKFAPIDLLDYIYAVLHSPAYRERYKEFLKIDFPRVPYPDDAKRFRKLVKLGGKLRRLHLMEGIEPQPSLANFPEPGSCVVEKFQYIGGNVYINDTQYFEHVPQEAWEFYIGGYQPAQKWLKDRKGRKLTYDEITHYQRVIRILQETDETMREVDEAMLS